MPLGPLDSRRCSGSTRGRSRCSPCVQAVSKDSPRRSVPGTLGSLGCILPGQVLSPSPPRRPAAARRPSKANRYSPGRSLYRDSGHGPTVIDCAIILGREHSCGEHSFDTSWESAGDAVSSCTAGATTPTLRGAITEARMASGFCCETAWAGPEEEKAPCPRGRRGRREGAGGKSGRCSEGSRCSDRGSPSVHKGPGDDVDRLIARCMTHERPAVLMQAGSAMLDACIARLGEEAPSTEKRSDKIRQMLRLTDQLRRYNADLTERGVPTKSPAAVTAVA